jgi:cell shape-determining protein MreC
MIRKVMGSTMVLAAVLMAGESVYAAPLTALHVPVQAMGKNKQMVSFHLRNDSAGPLVVKAGSQEMTLDPGKPVDVTLKVGDTITIAKSTKQFPEGTLIATVNPDLKDTTIALR